jgi:ParB family chromosome partitioning protein
MEDRNFEIEVSDDAASFEVSKPMLETSFGGETKIEQVALSRLCLSPHNVRRKVSTGIKGLADNIAAKGLLQNLVAHPMKGARGKKTTLCVCAGQRRLAALQLMAERGTISPDEPIPVKVVTEAEAVATSLIENFSRESMHGADQAMAFRLLIDEGKSADYVAALFSVPVLTVQRRLKIANVSPKLLDVYRDDGMTTDQVIALALTDDHGLQEHLWFDAAQSWLRDPHQLRSAITSEEIDVRNNPLVEFVTLDAYEAAGGFVRRDLFSDADNAGYIADAALLQRLATERLVAIAQTVREDGWKWVEPRIKRDYSELSAYGRLSSHSRDMTKKEASELAKLQKARDKAIKELDAYYDDESIEEDDDKRDTLDEAATAASEACGQYVERLESWTPEQLACGGAFVFLNHAGEVIVERGYVKPEDKMTAARDAGANIDHFAAEKKEKPLHSEKLCRRLTAHRTAAVQVELAANPSVALAVLMHRMIPAIFSERYGYIYGERTLEVQVTCSHDKLLREADDMAASLAWKEIDAERLKWSAMLPTNIGDLLPWLLTQTDDVMANLFAFCVAATLDSVSATDSAHPVNALSGILNLDMAKYWTPTREGYLNHVSKSRIADVVATAVSPDAAAPLGAMKKDAAAEAAELRLASTGWLPEVLTNREVPKACRADSCDDRGGDASDGGDLDDTTSQEDIEG